MDLIGCGYLRSRIDSLPEPLVTRDDDVGRMFATVGQYGIHSGQGPDKKENDKRQRNPYHPDFEGPVAGYLFGVFLLALRTVFKRDVAGEDDYQEQDGRSSDNEFDYQLPDACGLWGGSIKNGGCVYIQK